MSKKFIKTERRSFLKGAVVATGAAAVIPATTTAAEAPAPVKVQDKADKGYAENDLHQFKVVIPAPALGCLVTR